MSLFPFYGLAGLSLDAIPHQIWIADARGLQIYANKQWYDYTGLTTEEMEKQQWRSVLHPQDQTAIQQAWRDALAAGTDLCSNVRLRRHDGVYCWHTIRATVQRDAEDHIWLWVGTCTDIENQKRAEQTLKVSEENFHVLAETVPQHVWTALPDGSAVYGNRRFLDYLQIQFQQAQGLRWKQFIYPDDLEQVLALWSRSQETGEPYEVEYRLKEGRTGAYRWFLIRAMPLRDTSGQIIKWFGTSTDIHEHKRIEAALQENELRFRRLMDANIIGITVVDPDGTILEANEAYLSLLGYTQEDLAAGRINWRAMTPPEYQERSKQTVEELLKTGKFLPREKEYLRKNGSRVPVMIGGTLFRKEDSVTRWVTLTQDLTAHKEVDRQKDFFLAMTGHELKTPLTALKGTLQLLQRRVQHFSTKPEVPLSEMRTFLDDCSERLTGAVRQVDVQTHVINDLLDVSRMATNTLQLEQEPCDLVSLVSETVADLRLTAPSRSLLFAAPEHLTLMVLADRYRIGQVVRNYVTNALRYAPAAQPIQIGLSVREQSARVWVQDRGPGLSKEEQEEVWQRFRQVKGVATQGGSEKGLGLGLYLCQMLIAEHQGQVGVESTPGEGSTFWFTLPLIS